MASPKRERVVRDDILSVLRDIRVEPGQALRQVEPAQIIYERAKEFAKWAPNATKTGELYRFKMNFVYGLLIEDGRGRGVSLDGIQSRGVIEGWQNACKALLRYALNLHLAPKRPEFRRMKVGISNLYSHFPKGSCHVFLVLTSPPPPPLLPQNVYMRHTYTHILVLTVMFSLYNTVGKCP